MSTACLHRVYLLAVIASVGWLGVAQDLRPASPPPPPHATASDLAVWRTAIERGDVAKVKELLATRPDFVATNYAPGKSWLHLAVEHAREPVVALLLAAKADVNAPSGPGWIAGSRETALHIAARKGNAAIVRFLIQAGAKVDAREINSRTPLQLALQPWRLAEGVEQLDNPSFGERSSVGRRETIQLLCLAGADIFATNKLQAPNFAPYTTPFHAASAASARGHEAWLDHLLTNARPRTIRDPEGRSLIDLARRHDRWDALLVLASPEQPPPPTNAPPGKADPLQALVFHSVPGQRQSDGTRLEPRHYWELVVAGHRPDLFVHIGLEDLESVKRWVREHPGQLATIRDAEGRSPLHWSVTKGYAGMTELLMEHGADPAVADAAGCIPVQLAIELGNLALLQKLRPAVTRILRDETQPAGLLELSLLKGRIEVATWLVELGPSPNRPFLTGGTALHLAVRKAPATVTEKLLALGADPKARDHRDRTPLHLAVTTGDEAIVDALLRARAPLDLVDEAGRLPMHEAARLGHARLLAKLLPPAALIHQADKSNRTALELAVLGNHAGAVETLLAQQPDLQRRGPAGGTLLHLGAQAAGHEVLAQLLSAGASVTAVDDRQRTPLHIAAERGQTNLVLKLIQAEAPALVRDRDGKSPVDLALQAGHSEIARLLTSASKWKPDPAARQTTPLHTAAAAGNYALVQELLQLTPTPDLVDEHGQTPFVLAAHHDRHGLFPLLLGHGANINATNQHGHTPLYNALAQRAFWQVLQLLLHCAAPDHTGETNGHTPLHMTLSREVQGTDPSPWQVEFDRLVASGQLPANAAFSTWLRRTNTLHAVEEAISAWRQDNLDWRAEFDRLLEAGSIQSGTPYTTWLRSSNTLHLMEASLTERRSIRTGFLFYDHPERIHHEPWKLILAAGADPRIPNRQGRTALHIFTLQTAINGAPYNTHLSRLEVVVAELVRRGADPNARDEMGHTPLHEAARLGRARIVEALLRHGADARLLTGDGQPITRLALQCPWPPSNALAVLQVLARYGVDLNLKGTNGQTVAHHLLQIGDRGTFLLGEGASEFFKLKLDLDARDNNGDTPLHVAVRHGLHAAANVLNRYGANPLVRNNAGETPWSMVAALPHNIWPKASFLVPGAKLEPSAAAAVGDLVSLKAWHAVFPDLLHRPLWAERGGDPPVTIAARHRQTNAVDFILAHGGQPDVFVALRLGRHQLLDTLLHQHAKGVQATPFGAPLLHHAVLGADTESVTVLLRHRAERNAVDTMGFTALYHALTNGNETVIAQLRSAGARENAFDLVALNRPAALKALIATNLHAATAGTLYQRERQPLLLAMQCTNLAAVEILLEAGADPEMWWIKSYMNGAVSGPTLRPRLLHAAVMMEQPALVRLLLNHAADPNGMDGSGFTPLHFAAWTGQTNVIKMLLDGGADPNARLAHTAPARQPPMTMVGERALHVAVIGGQTNAIRLLVERGADLQGTNSYGLTPLGLLQAGGGLGGKLSLSMVPADPKPGGRPPRLPPNPAPRAEVIALLQSLEALAKAGLPPAAPTKQP